MRLFIRYFFKTAQYIIGPVILLGDKLFPPRGMVRSPAEQQQVDASSSKLVLYQFKMCPFCVKVRRAIKRLSLKIETRDALRQASSREELLAGGGEIKVPCLRITDDAGTTTWMYESSDIVAYLQERFAAGAVSHRDSRRGRRTCTEQINL
jgi:glutaredoxin